MSAPEGNVAALVMRAASGWAGAPALVRPDGRIASTVGELAELGARTAGWFQLRGIGPGSVVLVGVRAFESALPIVVGAIWAGAAVTAPRGSRGLRATLALAASAQPDVVVADPLAAVLCSTQRGLRRAIVSLGEVRRAMPRAISPVDVAGSAPALIGWTTGTTGPPQPVVRSHDVLRAQHAAVARLRGLRVGDIDLAGLPALALNDLAQGVGVTMAGAKVRPAALRETVRRSGATAAAGFPALFERLVRQAMPAELSRLRSIHVGGAPVPVNLVRALRRVAPRAEIVVVYGMTEAEPIAALGADEYERCMTGRTPGDGTLAGTPVGGMEVRIERFAGRRYGRVLVRGQAVVQMPGRMDNGQWLDTGDVGRLDNAGRVWLLGRAANVIQGTAPGEVEEHVATVPGVLAAAVVGVDGGPGGRGVLALQVSAGARASCTAEVRRLIDLQGWPVDRVVRVAVLPTDVQSGTKIDYRRLRKML